MKTKKNTPVSIRELIISHYTNGLSLRAISEATSVPKSTVGYIINKFKNNKSICDSPRIGRPKKTSKHIDKIIVRKSISDPQKNAVVIRREIQAEYNVVVSRFTIARRLIEKGLNARVPVKKPCISKKNRAARLKFARDHQHWTIDDWKKVIFTDESKFKMFGSDGRTYVRRPNGKRYDPKYQVPTIKHGGGCVMIWGGFHYEGLIPLVEIQGIMDKIMYKNILEEHLLPYARQKMNRGWLFQQDNDPKHSSGLVKAWLNKKKINILEWPSQSPDLNPIEHMWEVLGRRVMQYKHTSKANLFNCLKEEWLAITPDVIQNLIESMPRRCAAVIEAKGYATKY